MTLLNKIEFVYGILAGAYFALLGCGVLPRKPTEKQQLWRKRHGTTVGVVGFCMFFFGTIFFLFNLYK